MVCRSWLMILAVAALGMQAWSQNPAPADQPVPQAQPAATAPAPQPAPAPSAEPAPAATQEAPPAAQTAPATKTYTVPAGTKVLLQLRSSVNTKSARPGDGVYLASIFPVVVGNRVLIPEGVYVQGVVDRVQRAGHVKGRAQLDMHFTSMIFPNGTVVEIPGQVDNLPGASQQSVDKEGTIQQEGDKTRNLGKVAEVSIPAGGTVGSLAGLGSGHPLAGGLAGLAGGAAAAGLVSLFTRGADVNIQAGTQVEMVLQRPLVLEEGNLAAGNASPALVPAAQQPRPMEKPQHARILCPPGGLGCE